MRRVRPILALAVLASVLAVPSASSAAPLHTYVTMSDGVKLAVSISFPPGFDQQDEGAWPTLFQMDGYGGGGSAIPTDRFGDKYVTVYASIRGTGCSGGRFDLFDRRHAQDGYEIIENFIVNQPWSNKKVGIIGHSYPGLTGWLVASTDPPHVEAVAISGLIDDLYRGIVYPGGVPNLGFPAIWTLGLRPAYELAGNAGRYQNETTSGDPTCAANIASRPPRDVPNDPVVEGLNREDSTWWQAKAMRTYIRGITKPIHITQQHQDEQTGPRGGHVLWENIPDSIPKRLVLTNGVHSTTSVGSADRLAWLDCWIRGDCRGDIADPARRVRVHFETRSNGVNPPYVSSDWPLPETAWTRYYLGPEGSVGLNAPTTESSTSYVNLPGGRQTAATTGGTVGTSQYEVGRFTYASGPDRATYRLSFPQPTTIAGPINMTLYASSTAPDTDFFVDLIDVGPDGKWQYIQRGMQRASHRAISPLQSDYIESGPSAGTLYRAHHPHTNPAPIVPGQAERFEIEIFPVGHHFRQGHQLEIQVHAPPPVDPLSVYAYVSAQPAAVNTILHGPAHPTSVLLPVLPATPPLGAAPACGAQIGIPCFTPVT